jgi:methyl-accepting chemotaxis protein
MNTADSTSLSNAAALKSPRFQLFANLPVRAKLLLAFLAITAISASMIAFFSDRTTSAYLTQNVGRSLQNAATQNGLAVGGTIERQVSALQAFSLNKALKDAVEASNAQQEREPKLIDANLQKLDREWKAAEKGDILVFSRLNSTAAAELIKYSKIFSDNVEVFVTDKYGGLVAATNRTSDYVQSDEDWWQAAWSDSKGATYIGQPENDQSSASFAIAIATPIYDTKSDQIIGILRTTYRLDNLIKTVESVHLGDTGRAQLLLPGGQLITADSKTVPVNPQLGEQLLAAAAAGYSEVTVNDTPSLISLAPVATINQDALIARLGWLVFMQQSRDESLATVAATQQTIFLTSLGALALSGLLALVVAQLISAPIARLTTAASAIASGDLSRRLGMRRRDEIGMLAANFDSMAEALEGRIAAEQEARAAAQWLQQVETDNRQLLERAVAEYLAFVEQVAQGDLRQQLSSRYDGALGQLGAGLSNMVASLRDITSQVQVGTNAIAAAVAQISAATTEQAASSAQQSAAITETATAIEEVKVIAVQTADQATQVAHNGQKALEVAHQSDQTVTATVGSMGQIRQQVGSIAQTIRGLSDQTRSISTIITSVSELADQINHLALNAAIETTRSGDQDRDIAALARLVRDLGQQAKEATKQVRMILSEIQSSTKAAVAVTDEGSRRVEAGVQLVTETGMIIHQIAAEVESGAQANVHMAAAAQQQTLGMQQIAQAMTAIQQAMTQTLIGTRQTEQAAQGLLALAQSLQQAIAVYRM